MSDRRPIGIFDSGVGGLTVARALRHALPAEDLVYFGDTQHMPYGERSAEAVEHFSVRIAEFLLAQNCKMLVIACNTASAVATHRVVQRFGSKVPVLNVIDPIIAAVGKNFSEHASIGVIATKRTIESKVYQEKLLALSRHLKVAAKATPLLAAAIEEGFGHHPVGKALLEAYFADQALLDLDALILGCTHYPIVKADIQALLPPRTQLMDAGELIAEEARRTLETQSLTQSKENLGQLRCWVSDYTETFATIGRVFLGEPVQLEHYRFGIRFFYATMQPF